ncbi:MAG: hypothetical protein WD578_11990 [Bacteroidales bacterium]
MKPGPLVVVFMLFFCLVIDAQMELPFETGTFSYLADKVEDCPEGYQCTHLR